LIIDEKERHKRLLITYKTILIYKKEKMFPLLLPLLFKTITTTTTSTLLLLLSLFLLLTISQPTSSYTIYSALGSGGLPHSTIYTFTPASAQNKYSTCSPSVTPTPSRTRDYSWSFTATQTRSLTVVFSSPDPPCDGFAGDYTGAPSHIAVSAWDITVTTQQACAQSLSGGILSMTFSVTSGTAYVIIGHTYEQDGSLACSNGGSCCVSDGCGAPFTCASTNSEVYVVLDSYYPTSSPSKSPSRAPSKAPSKSPRKPSKAPSKAPSKGPSKTPSKAPSKSPRHPSKSPSLSKPSRAPSRAPSHTPTASPTIKLLTVPDSPQSATGKLPTQNQLNLYITMTPTSPPVVYPLTIRHTSPITNGMASVISCDGGVTPAASSWITVTSSPYTTASPTGTFDILYRVNASAAPGISPPSQIAVGILACIQVTATKSSTSFVGSTMMNIMVVAISPCPRGTNSSTGDNSINSCTPCPAGGYESLSYDRSTVSSRQVCQLLPCSDQYWCGKGAVEGSTYVKYFDVSAIKASVFTGAGRDDVLKFTIVHSAPDTIIVQQTPNEKVSYFVLVGGDIGISISTAATSTEFPVTVHLTSNNIDTSQGFFHGRVELQWHLASDPVDATPFLFFVDVHFDFFTVIVTPQIFSYKVPMGESLQISGAEIVPSFDVWNVLCNGTMVFKVEACNMTSSSATDDSTSWLSFDYNKYSQFTLIDSLADRGVPVTVPFGVSLDPFKNSTKLPSWAVKIYQNQINSPKSKATVLDACLRVTIDLGSLNPPIEKDIKITVAATLPCPPGYLSDTGTNDVGCTACGVNKYQNGTGSKFCNSCPESRPVTLREATISSDNCVTQANSFLLPGNQPRTCPEGADCSIAGLTLDTLPLKPNYWRISSKSLDIRKCRRTGVCLGGSFFPNMLGDGNGTKSPTSVSRRSLEGDEILDNNDEGPFIHNSENASVLCAPFHHGPLCESCLNSSYVKRGNRCAYCDQVTVDADKGRIAGILFAIGFTLVVCSAGFAYNGVKKAISDHKHSQRFYTRVDILMKLKILLGEFQVLGSMSLEFNIVLPEFYFGIATFYQLIKFDFWTFLDVGCAFPPVVNNFYASLLVATIAPASFILLIVIVFVITDRVVGGHKNITLHESMRRVTYSIVLFTLYLCYPSVSSTILSTWSCDLLEDGSRPLRADYSLSCDDPIHTGFTIYSVFMFLIYVVGVPSVSWYLLFTVREHINPPAPTHALALALREDDLRIAHLRFLWIQMKPNRWWYETVDMLRRLLLSSAYVFLDRGSANQMICQVALAMIFLVILNAVRPYEQASNAVLAVATQYVILCVSMISLVLRLGGSSIEEKDKWNAMLIVFVFVGPGLAVGQIISEMLGEKTYRKFFPCINWDRIESFGVSFRSRLVGGGGGSGGNHTTSLWQRLGGSSSSNSNNIIMGGSGGSKKQVQSMVMDDDNNSGVAASNRSVISVLSSLDAIFESTTDIKEIRHKVDFAFREMANSMIKMKRDVLAMEERMISKSNSAMITSSSDGQAGRMSNLTASLTGFSSMPTGGEDAQVFQQRQQQQAGTPTNSSNPKFFAGGNNTTTTTTTTNSATVGLGV
jgi:hypothetical protein